MKVNNFKKSVIFVSIGAALLLFGCSNNKKGTNSDNTENKLPNIIYILADDLGYGDISALGQEKFDTPNIDKLIADGMFFTQHYSGSTVCAPSRSALLTGQHTGNTPIRGNIEISPEGQHPMPENPNSLSNLFKNAGYVTGAFGKWGLGFIGTTGDANNQGFDEFLGYNCQRMAHRYYPPYIWHNSEKYWLEGNDWTNMKVYAQDVIQEKTLEFIDKNKDKPFFLYVPSLIPHAELVVPEDSIWDVYKDKFPETPYVSKRKGADYGPDLDPILYKSVEKPRATHASMIARLDMHVGQIVAKINELGLEKNTLIIFTTDNGPHQEGGADPDFFNSNGGFRGYKRDLYEGGVRVPMVAKWDGVIKPGTTSNHISAFWDMLPTFCDLAGIESPAGIDGISLAPTLTGNGLQKEHEYLYWEFHERGGRQAVRMGNWKGVKYNVFSGKSKVELYDLSVDPSESNNIADENPDVVTKIEELMKSARTHSDIFTFQSVTVKGD